MEFRSIVLFSALIIHIGLPCCGKYIHDKSTLSYGQHIWLQRILKALGKVIGFYKFHYTDVNVDSIYGLRVAEGALVKAIEKLSVSHDSQSKQSFHNKIKRLHYDAKTAATKSLEPMRLREPKYFDKFKHLVAKPWVYSRQYVKYDPKFVTKVTNNGQSPGDDFDEDLSDFCMVSLMGTSKEEPKGKCNIPDRCWTKMTKIGTGGYYITHQALFFLLAEVSGCHDAIMQKAGNEESLQKIYQHLGSNIHYQAKELFAVGITPEYKDIFMEQVVICGMLGIIQCYDFKWIELIQSWQDVGGCFKEPKYAEMEKEEINRNEKGHTVVVSTEIIELEATEKEGADDRRPSSRKILMERELSDGCLSHMTGIGTALFGTYVRWLLDPPAYEELGLQAPWKSTGTETKKPHRFFLLFYLFALTLLVITIYIKCKRRRCIRFRIF